MLLSGGEVRRRRRRDEAALEAVAVADAALEAVAVAVGEPLLHKVGA